MKPAKRHMLGVDPVLYRHFAVIIVAGAGGFALFSQGPAGTGGAPEQQSLSSNHNTEALTSSAPSPVVPRTDESVTPDPVYAVSARAAGAETLSANGPLAPVQLGAAVN